MISYPRSVWDSDVFGPSQLSDNDIERLVIMAKTVDSRIQRKSKQMDFKSRTFNEFPCKSDDQCSNSLLWLIRKASINRICTKRLQCICSMSLVFVLLIIILAIGDIL